MNDMELRFVDFTVDTSDDDSLKVKGYVNEVGKYSHTLGVRKKFKERILPGAFTRALSQDNDIHFLAEHDANKILASTRNNSLKLVEDSKGLYMEADISATSYGKDYHTLIKDGILRNMSFGFNVLKDKWKKLNDGTYTRDISELRLFEVSVVTNPAYPQSTISARGFNIIEDVDIPADVENMEENNMEKRKEEVVTKVETVNEKEVEKTTEEVTETTEETTEVAEEKKDESEQRAYIEYIYDQRELMNILLRLSADCMSVVNFFNKKEEYKDKVKTFKDFAKTCSDMMFNEVEEPAMEQNTVENMRNADVEEQDNTEKEQRDLTEYYSILDELK